MFPSPQCAYCIQRFAEDFEEDAPEGLHCRAFPDGIPDSIIELRADHRQPVRGDSGIRYTPAEDAPPDEYWDDIFRPVHA